MNDTSFLALRTGLSTMAVAISFSLALLPAAETQAQDMTGAARAYSRGQDAELNGDHSRAAELYESAFALAPAPAALRSAVRMRQAAGQMASAATLAALLLASYPDDTASREIAEELLEEASPTLLRVDVTCAPACTLTLDGFAAALDSAERHVLFARPGRHEVVATFAGGTSANERVEGSRGESTELSLIAPAPSATEPPDDPFGEPGTQTTESGGGGGITPIVFGTGLALTVGLGAVTIWSGVDTLSARDTYDTTMTRELYDDGLGRELRTNVLIAATAGLGVATLVIAIFTDWGGDESSDDQASMPPVMISATPDAVHAFAWGTF